MRVMHIIDSLSLGGAERVAVNMVNSLNEAGVVTFLCATRQEGTLKEFVRFPRNYFFLSKSKFFDVRAFIALARIVKRHEISILHAHSSSFFIAVVCKFLVPSVRVVWHDHYGLSDQVAKRHSWPIRLLSPFFDSVIVVNKRLHQWAQRELWTAATNVVCLPNYADLHGVGETMWTSDRLRTPNILCLANLRPQKDHFTLISAFKKIKEKRSNARLLLVGKDNNDDYSSNLKNFIDELEVEDVVIFGEQRNIGNFLNQASIGVLSSLSEGLPLALLEYGFAGLPVVCTDVGDCRTALKDGNAGILVSPGDAQGLANALEVLLSDCALAAKYSSTLHQFVHSQYSKEKIMAQVITIYTDL